MKATEKIILSIIFILSFAIISTKATASTNAIECASDCLERTQQQLQIQGCHSFETTGVAISDDGLMYGFGLSYKDEYGKPEKKYFFQPVETIIDGTIINPDKIAKVSNYKWLEKDIRQLEKKLRNVSFYPTYTIEYNN